MSRLFAAEAATRFLHTLVNKAVSDIGRLIFCSRRVKRAEKSAVRHDGRNDFVFVEHPPLFETACEDIDYTVAVNGVSVFIDRKASVGVAVERKSDVEMFLSDEAAERVRMCEPQFSLTLTPSGDAPMT